MEVQVIAKRNGRRRKREERRTNAYYLAEDLWDNILLRIPLKPLTRFKSVSKAWCKQITELRRSGRQPIFSSCIVLNTCSGYTILLTPRDQGRECITTKSVRVANLLDAHDGLHLYVADASYRLLYMTTTMHNKIWRLPSIPEDLRYNLMDMPRLRCFSVINTSQSKHKFELVCFTINRGDIEQQKIDCLVFRSSDDDKGGEWTGHQARLLKPKGTIKFTPILVANLSGVCCGGKIFWLIERLLFVYQIDRKLFRIVKLPREHPRHVQGLMWESEGSLYYCHSNDSGLYIWTYIADDDYHYDSDDWTVSGCGRDKVNWLLKQKVEIGKVRHRIHEITGIEPESQCPYMKPLLFNDELQVIYFEERQTTGLYFLISYSLVTQEFTKAWSYLNRVYRGFLSPLNNICPCLPLLLDGK